MKRMNRTQPSPLTFNYQGALNRITNRIRQSLELQEILSATAIETRAFLDTDRVKIYRFHSDGNGEVVAEAMSGNRLPSLKGLNFPASDIPAQARTLFIKARSRVIVDVTSQRKTISHLDDPQTGASLGTEHIRYAPVDACHAEYLAAMGVCSSLVVPILYHNQLWGLLVSHHAEPRQYSQDQLQVVQLLVDQVSIAIAQANLLSHARQQLCYETTINHISRLLHAPYDVVKIRQSVLEETVKALKGNGGRLYINADISGNAPQLYTSGAQPTLARIEESQFWQQVMGVSAGKPLEYCDILSEKSERYDDTLFDQPTTTPQFHSIHDLYKNPQLQFLAPAFETTTIRSILIVPLQYRQQCIGCLSVFRQEVDTEILWAGQWNEDERNIRPRQSFEMWREVKKGLAQEWTADEIKLAQALGTHLYMAVMQRRVEDMIRHQASHDRLTGLPNRLLFDERLSLALAYAHQQGEMLAVMFLDLDRFKVINDTLGHTIGDQLLQRVSHRIAECLKKSDTIARWGGDEFTLILPQVCSANDAIKIAARIIRTLQAPFDFGEQEFHVTTSIGIALAPYDGEDVETLLKNADTAMYRAKQQGKNNFQLYAADMNTQALEQLVLANDLYKALNRNEFFLHYQPQVDLKTGQVVGTEALVRWQHPERGLIPPNQFISLAEETGQIVAIGEWVLHTACAQNQAWQDAGYPPIRVAVNLSARQFQRQNLAQLINRVLAETGLAARYLEVEITESIAMQDIHVTTAILNELRAMGVHISIDDFGTGYSSLATLKRFPLHTLKIDREFVKDSTTSVKDAALIQAIVTLGHGLDLDVIAEGVETVEQQKFLRSIGCDAMQGYLFSKPLPATDIAQRCFNQAP
ncbi:EAL domain-containing protein [Phormidium sp. CLA17]|uniref:bifunctional diguanylate cyclase/phosphodiesterase n=1 Tax=Leptolyngbya sp. Cla-17 TaxID=2803751 RepID=UPI0018D95520|nr:EAL domain-containing protein [Leptolyngbya sp. Cla-17]MBM0743558.1 EAL domain-containing protein [Leptolyngbya sp. Cla-17]